MAQHCARLLDFTVYQLQKTVRKTHAATLLHSMLYGVFGLRLFTVHLLYNSEFCFNKFALRRIFSVIIYQLRHCMVVVCFVRFVRRSSNLLFH